MKAPDFSYEKPTSISDVLALLANDELDCQLLAGRAKSYAYDEF
jgi:CO/xanthine dehydrogenase FAD-binding subunit